MTAEIPPTPRTFFVIQSDPVISMDIAGALWSHFPQGVTHVFDQLEAAIDQIEAAAETACILIASDLMTTAAMDKTNDILARGARVVIIGSGDAGGGAAIVTIPFTTQMILDVLG